MRFRAPMFAVALLAFGAAGCATSTGSLNTSPTADPTAGDTFPTRGNGAITQETITNLCDVRPVITGATAPDGRPCPPRQDGGEWPGFGSGGN